MTDLNPTELDLDAWIDGTQATQRSIDLYQRGDLVAVAEELMRRYEVAQKVPADQRGINDETPESLLGQIEECKRTLDETRATVTVRALSPEQIEAAEKAARRENEKNPDVTAHQIAAAVVRVQVGDKVATSMTPAQVKALRERVGPQQVLRVMKALMEAQSQEPKIAAPFSQRS